MTAVGAMLVVIGLAILYWNHRLSLKWATRPQAEDVIIPAGVFIVAGLLVMVLAS